MPVKSWELNRPKFSDDMIRIPRPPIRVISNKIHRWAECPMCQMPQLLVDIRRGFQLVKCNWCSNTWKVRVTNFGRIKVEGMFQ